MFMNKDQREIQRKLRILKHAEDIGAEEPLANGADKAYGSAKIRRQIADAGTLAVILSKSNAKKPIPQDKNLYAMRNIVERFFRKMKDMRRLVTRFDKHAADFQYMLFMVAIRCWLNCAHT